MFKRKHSITILNENWAQLVPVCKLNQIPRKDELIFLDLDGKYYQVLNIIHYLNKNQGIFIIVKESETQFRGN